MAAPENDCAQIIRAAIESAGGAITFQRFHELALYGPDGFFTTAGRAGRRGDFLTSPEVGPLFGAVLARWLDAEWERLGRPDPFTLVEAGAGPGTLARSVLAAESACMPALRYLAIEASAVQRADHPHGIESSADLPPGPLTGVVVANELLDDLPFRLAVFDGAWREAYVSIEGDGFAEVLSVPFDPVPIVLPAGAALGARAPLVDVAAGWVAAARQLLRAGTVLIVDYCRPTTTELAQLPWREWLRTYRGHERGGHYLADPGTQDVTCDVPLDQLPPPDQVSAQADFLRRHGLHDLVDEGRRRWAASAAAPDLAALAMRSRPMEAEALTDSSGLGGFTVAEWVVA